MTEFVFTEIRLPSTGRTLFLDGNSKISGWKPRPNALSLPAPLTCPGATPTCLAQCYAHSEKSIMPLEMRTRFEHNLKTIERALHYPESAFELGNWIEAYCQDVGFRWHVSGDVFSREYAHWIGRVCRGSPGVQHWIYTRSFEFVDSLQAPNLAVNLSADRDNLLDAFKCRVGRFTYLWTSKDRKHLHETGEGPSLPTGSVVFPGYGQRARDGTPLPPKPWNQMICPADYFGQSKSMRCGVCTKCGNPRS